MIIGEDRREVSVNWWQFELRLSPPLVKLRPSIQDFLAGRKGDLQLRQMSDFALHVASTKMHATARTLGKLEQEPRVRLLEWRTSRWSSRWTPTPFSSYLLPHEKEMWSMIFAMASWIIAISPVYRKHMMFVHPKKIEAQCDCLVGLLVYWLLTWRNSVDKDNEPSNCSRQCFYLGDVDIESGVSIVFSASCERSEHLSANIRA